MFKKKRKLNFLKIENFIPAFSLRKQKINLKVFS